MKINRLETHDRLQHFHADQSDNINQGCSDCLKTNPLSLALQEKSPYIYIFAHSRTSDCGTKQRMIWQPRISKPKAQTNSYLFRAISKTDNVEICWIIPPRERWKQHKKGQLFENDIITWSCDLFDFNRQELEKPAPDDLSEQQGQAIYKQVIEDHKNELASRRFKPEILAAF